MTSQNLTAMPKDRARESKQHCPSYLGLSQRGGASGEGRNGWVPAPAQEWEGQGCLFSPSPSPDREAARGIKLLEEWQKNRGQRNNKNQMTALPHGLQTWKKRHDWASKFVTGPGTEATSNCQVRNNLPWSVFPLVFALTPQRSSMLF